MEAQVSSAVKALERKPIEEFFREVLTTARSGSLPTPHIWGEAQLKRFEELATRLQGMTRKSNTGAFIPFVLTRSDFDQGVQGLIEVVNQPGQDTVSLMTISRFLNDKGTYREGGKHF